MHKHHVIPKHAGGTDDPSNLIEVTAEEHANLHLALYLEHGRWEDWYAFMGLSGHIGKNEIIRQKTLLGASKGGKVGGKVSKRPGYKHSQKTKDQIASAHLGKIKHTEESKKKLSEHFKGKPLSESHKKSLKEAGKKRVGKSAHNTGRKWYTNGVNNLFTREHPGEGWRTGRVINSSK